MPRKPKSEKKTVVVVVVDRPVTVTLHPPAGARRSWYAYWPGLVASKSTGQRKLDDAILVAEGMVKNDGRRGESTDAPISDEEFEQIQRAHYSKKQGEEAQARATKLLAENPWRQFTWVEGYERPLRQFDGGELVSLLDYLDRHWPGVTVAALLAKLLLWSGGRRAEVTSLTWPQRRLVGAECHFQIVGKWGAQRWFRIPEALHAELLSIRSTGPFVFAAYNEQLRRFQEGANRPGTARVVGRDFSPVCRGPETEAGAHERERAGHGQPVPRPPCCRTQPI